MSSSTPTATVPSQARVVIIGGGIMGCSTAYHLAKLGWKDIVLLEQGRLSGGTTWHAAGLVGQLRSVQNLTRLIRYSTELYSKLEAETGLATGWKQSGSLIVARTEERMTLLRAADAPTGRRQVSDHAHRRSRGRRVAAGGRQGQSDRHHPVAGQGRP
jgi:4-methylaminobutanoate oxidase (formaldehyde-forming)